MRKVSFIFHAAKKSNVYYLLFNFTQQSTNNTQNEYKCLMVFVLQVTSLTSFLQTSHKAENASFSDIIARLNKTMFLE